MLKIIITVFSSVSRIYAWNQICVFKAWHRLDRWLIRLSRVYLEFTYQSKNCNFIVFGKLPSEALDITTNVLLVQCRDFRAEPNSDDNNVLDMGGTILFKIKGR